MKTGTICSKHDEITELAESIIKKVAKCKEDGVRMEEGLNNKRKTIEELEYKIDELEERIRELESSIELY